MAKWVFADNSISALPQANLTDTYSIPNGGLSGSGTVFNLSGDRKALFFCKGNFIPVDSLELFPAGMQKKEAADRCLAGSVRPISGKITYGDTCTVTVKDAVLFARPDCAVLRIAIKAEKNISGSRLIVHADYKDGRMVSYDKYLRADSGFRKKEGVYRKDLFIQDLSRLRSVSVYLSDKSGALSRESRTAGKRIVINF
jgi:hypothetical protein